MTPEELQTLLNHKDLHNTLDVKTLVIDLVKKKELSELEEMFWDYLPLLSEEQVKGYLFMSRG
jgi:hypothetical protein